MDPAIVQLLLAFLQPNPSGSIAGQAQLKQAIAKATASAKTIIDPDKRNLWLVVIQLIDVLYFQSIN